MVVAINPKAVRPIVGPADAVLFQQAGTLAVSRSAQDKMREGVSVLDFIPTAQHAAILAGTSTYDASADIQAALDSHETVSIKGGITVCVASPVGWTSDSVNRRYALHIEGGSTLKALGSFSGDSVFYFDADADGNMPLNFAVTGTGKIDCADVAPRGVYVKIGGRGNIGAIEVKNPTLHGIHVGDPGKATACYEVNTNRALVWRQSSLGHNNSSSSIGIYYQNCTDSVISQVVSTGFRVGGKSSGASITWVDFHPWSVAGHGPMTHGLWIAGQDSIVIAPYADTPHSRNYDASIDGTITEVFGLYLDAYGAQVSNVKVFLNQTHAVDNVCTGIFINKNDGLFGSIKGVRYEGGTTAKYKRYVGQLGRTDIAGTTLIGQFGSGTTISYDANNITDWFFTTLIAPGATLTGAINGTQGNWSDRQRVTTSFAGFEFIHSSNPVNPLYQHGYRWALNNDDTYRLQYTTNNFSSGVLDRLTVAADGGVTIVGKIGFYNATPASKPTITGSKGANAALTSLLTQLAALGLITDSTT